MKKLLLFFIIFSSLLRADVYLTFEYDSDTSSYKNYNLLDGFLDTTLDDYGMCSYYSGNIYIKNKGVVKSPTSLDLSNYNLDCLKKNSTLLCSSSNDRGANYVYKVNYLSYCSIKNGCSYDSVNNLWICNDDVICPPNKFKIGNECQDSCPAGSVYFTWKDGNNYCIQKDDFSTLSEVFGINLDNCEYDDNYYTINGASSIKLICGDEYVFLPYADSDVSFSSSDVSLTEPTTIECDGGEDAVIDENGDITCVPVEEEKTDNNTSDSSDSNTTDTTNDSTESTDSSSTNDDSKNDSNTSDSNSTVKKECPDPCRLKSTVGTEISVSGNCHIIKKPKYDGCTLMFHYEKGKCVPGCNTADVDGDINATIDVSSITTRLDSLNQKMDDFMNLEPDGTYNPEATLADDESAIYNQFSTFYNNAQTTINSTIEQLNNLVEIAKNKDSYQVTLFENQITSCPLTAKIYGSTQTIDICSFISPFRPILQTFFTIIFNMSVLFGFFRIVIFRKV